MAIRKVLVATLGHVDHGKTSLLDRIRSTTVASGEAGAITQAIGVSIIPMAVIQKVSGRLLDSFKSKLTVPGFLMIDTPGHAAFISLRKRGGNLADIAILVVDINEGFRPQTLESIEILKANKVPFVIAANKIDLIAGWNYEPAKMLIENINALSYQVQGIFEQKMYELVGKFQELGFESERFDRVQDYTKQLAIIPLSAKTGQGIPELLAVLTVMAQKYLEQKLQIEEEANAKGTILEVKEEKGLGTTLNAIIYNGHLALGDTLIIGNTDQALVTKVKILLEPGELAEMRDKKSKFQNVKEVYAATGVKIVAPGTEKALAGMPLRSCSGKAEEIAKLSLEIQEEVRDIIIDSSEEVGVTLKADTIGGLEALRHLLQEQKIPIATASLGDVTRQDLLQAESMRAKNEFYAVVLGFNITVPDDIQTIAKDKNIKVITHQVIYKIIEDYNAHTETVKKEVELRELSLLVRPCKFAILKGFVFRQNNPAVVGIEIEIGKIKAGDPIMNAQGKRISQVKSMEESQESLTVAEQGKQVAMAMDGVTVGRQINEGDYLYTDIPEGDFKKLKELKKHLSKTELEVLREIVDIKRKDNPVWGVG
ncbi:MAG: translation initiation factor 5B [archaeon GW2011_AR9]|nr:MAG: translation initiation factor 5B [archaeon GW2011_AR9]MBS3120423.1 translation initiation factor IF-2 [Candidatus Woesearchaeota archaeon]HIG93819.1 translation initiation factor IF-2 [Candidatus Woesearchaeota archaeon]